MSDTASFELTWYFRSTEFERLKALKTQRGFLLPQEDKGNIDQIYLVVNESRAVLHTWYYAIKKDGKLGQRRTEQTNLLKDKSWVSHLLGQTDWKARQALEYLWPHEEKPT